MRDPYDSKELCRRAREVARNAYAPHSRFRVGAAVQGRRSIYVGTNVENASYGLALCAERAALASAIARGDREIIAIAVACLDADPRNAEEQSVPCGACRQWFVELAANADVLICGTEVVWQVSELLPRPFRLPVGDEE